MKAAVTELLKIVNYSIVLVFSLVLSLVLSLVSTLVFTLVFSQVFSRVFFWVFSIAVYTALSTRESLVPYLKRTKNFITVFINATLLCSTD